VAFRGPRSAAFLDAARALTVRAPSERAIARLEERLRALPDKQTSAAVLVARALCAGAAGRESEMRLLLYFVASCRSPLFAGYPQRLARDLLVAVRAATGGWSRIVNAYPEMPTRFTRFVAACAPYVASGVAHGLPAAQLTLGRGKRKATGLDARMVRLLRRPGRWLSRRIPVGARRRMRLLVAWLTAPHRVRNLSLLARAWRGVGARPSATLPPVPESPTLEHSLQLLAWALERGLEDRWAPLMVAELGTRLDEGLLAQSLQERCQARISALGLPSDTAVRGNLDGMAINVMVHLLHAMPYAWSRCYEGSKLSVAAAESASSGFFAEVDRYLEMIERETEKSVNGEHDYPAEAMAFASIRMHLSTLMPLLGTAFAYEAFAKLHTPLFAYAYDMAIHRGLEGLPYEAWALLLEMAYRVEALEATPPIEQNLRYLKRRSLTT
jgi:hypothetical protein